MIADFGCGLDFVKILILSAGGVPGTHPDVVMIYDSLLRFVLSSCLDFLDC